MATGCLSSTVAARSVQDETCLSSTLEVLEDRGSSIWSKLVEHILVLLIHQCHDLFRATIDLIFVKGSTSAISIPYLLVGLTLTSCYRNNPGLARSVEVEEFDDPSLNCLCPMKLLLCHALRTGAVRETSWAEMRQAARERPSKRVIWAYPNRPVICAIAGDSKLTLDRPSPVASAQATNSSCSTDWHCCQSQDS